MAPLQLAGLVLGNTPAERIIPGLQVTVIGMGVVFAVLILLYVILTLVGKLGGDAASPAAPAGGLPAPAVIVAPPPAASPAADRAAAPQAGVSAAAASQEPGLEQLVAVLAAAIAAATVTGRRRGPAPSVERRRGSQPGWALAGRIALQTGRETLPRG